MVEAQCEGQETRCRANHHQGLHGGVASSAAANPLVALPPHRYLYRQYHVALDFSFFFVHHLL